jgi:hypothetical protein
MITATGPNSTARDSETGAIGSPEGSATWVGGAWRVAVQAGLSGALRDSRYRGLWASAEIQRRF